jgi:hypothetical protein
MQPQRAERVPPIGHNPAMLVVTDSGQPLDADFQVEVLDGETTIVFASRSGARTDPRARNVDYNPALALILGRLARLGAALSDAYVDSSEVQQMPRHERRLMPDAELPLALSDVGAEDLRLRLTRAQRSVGRPPGADGGNNTKRIRLHVRLSRGDPMLPSALEAELTGAAATEVAEAQVAVQAISGRRTGQGFSVDVMARRAIERRALDAAVDRFTAEGWDVRDVGDHQSYDLLCVRGAEELHVEVKGTTSDGEFVLLTRNEVEHARRFPRVALFVLAGVRVSRSADGALSVEGGRPTLLDPWQPRAEHLEPLAYRYTVRPAGDV